MGFYDERVLPRIINIACGMKVIEPLRTAHPQPVLFPQLEHV